MFRRIVVNEKKQPAAPGVNGFWDAFAFDDDPDLPAFDDEGCCGSDMIVLITLG